MGNCTSSSSSSSAIAVPEIPYSIIDNEVERRRQLNQGRRIQPTESDSIDESISSDGIASILIGYAFDEYDDDELRDDIISNLRFAEESDGGAFGYHRTQSLPISWHDSNEENQEAATAAVIAAAAASIYYYGHELESTMNSNVANSGPPPASPWAIWRLPRIRINGDADAMIVPDKNTGNTEVQPCNVCCEPYTSTCVIKQMPCGHTYHGKCIDAWLNRHCTCPVCRYELETEDFEYEIGRKERMKSRKPCVFSNNCIKNFQSDAEQDSGIHDDSNRTDYNHLNNSLLLDEDYDGKDYAWSVDLPIQSETRNIEGIEEDVSSIATNTSYLISES